MNTTNNLLLDYVFGVTCTLSSPQFQTWHIHNQVWSVVLFKTVTISQEGKACDTELHKWACSYGRKWSLEYPGPKSFQPLRNQHLQLELCPESSRQPVKILHYWLNVITLAVLIKCNHFGLSGIFWSFWTDFRGTQTFEALVSRNGWKVPHAMDTAWFSSIRAKLNSSCKMWPCLLRERAAPSTIS